MRNPPASTAMENPLKPFRYALALGLATAQLTGAALAADRTLGGLCDWVEAEAPRPVDLPVEGAASLKAAVIPVVLHYSTADQLA